jgi:HAD superfamily hydrolase (TIGR01484 family)
VDYLITEEIEVNESTRRWMELTSASVRRESKLGRHTHPHTVRVGIVAEPEEIERVKQALSERFAERVFFQSIFVPAQRVQVLEVFDPSVNKWEGVLHVARRHGITPEQIIAIGDDVNDIHMIANAGLGVAMGNARDEIKAIAGRIIGPNHEDGLAEFLEELIDSHMVAPMEDEHKGADAA